MKKSLVVFAVVALVVSLHGVGHAQVTGTIAAKATVLTAITVTGQSDLDFANVLPGVTKTIGTDGTATGGNLGSETGGVFKIEGEGTKEVQVTTTALPANIAKGADQLPITYLQADGCGYEWSNTGAATGTPAGSLAAATDYTVNLVGGVKYMHIGGKVAPSATQAAGAYTSNITITVIYTGS